MRAIFAAFCLFWGSIDSSAAESCDSTREQKVERYRTLLSDLSSSRPIMEPEAPIDLPSSLKAAIEDWTRN